MIRECDCRGVRGFCYLAPVTASLEPQLDFDKAGPGGVRYVIAKNGLSRTLGAFVVRVMYERSPGDPCRGHAASS